MGLKHKLIAFLLSLPVLPFRGLELLFNALGGLCYGVGHSYCCVVCEKVLPGSSIKVPERQNKRKQEEEE